MSYYPRYTPTSNNKFNPEDIITQDDSSSGAGSITIDLGSYVSKSAPQFDDDLYLKTHALNFNGRLQTNPFDSIAEETMASSKNKTTALSYANSVLAITGSVDLQNAAVRFTDETIPVSKITNLTTILTGIETNLANIISNDADILSHENHLTAIDSQVDLLKTHDTATDAAIATANGLITANGSAIQTNLDSITVLNTGATNAVNRITVNDGLISGHSSAISVLQNDVITNATAVLDYNNAWVAYASNNNVEKNDITHNILTNTTDISSLVGRADAFALQDIALNALLSAADVSIIAHGARIAVNEAGISNHELRVSAAETTILSNSAELLDHEARVTANSGDISTLVTSTAANATLLSTHTDAILTKQPIISSTSRLNTAFIGDGSVSNLRLSMLSDIVTTATIQSQLNALTSSLSVLDGLQDLDIVSIPQIQTDVGILQSDVGVLQSDVTAQATNTNASLAIIDGDITALETTQSTQSTSITALLSSDTAHDGQIAALATTQATQATSITALISSDAAHDGQISALNTSQTANLATQASTATSISNLVTSTATNQTAISALVSADGIHDTQLTALQNADAILQGNINLKQDLIVLMDSAKIHDVALNDTLDNILTIIDSNISTLSSSKQDVLSGVNKLDSLYLNLSTTQLQYVDITAPLKAQLTAITNSLSTLSALQNGDVASFAAIQDNFDTIELSKLDAVVYTNTISPAIASLTASISTLQGLQDGDIISFASINSSITNLTNTKQPLIDINAKLSGSLLDLSTTPLQYVDVGASIAGSLATLQTNIDGKQAVLSAANKLAVSAVDLTGSALANMDYGASVDAKMTSLDASIGALSANDVAQSTLNTTYSDGLAANATAISANLAAQTTINAAQATNNAAQTVSIGNLERDVIIRGESIVELELFENNQAVTNGSLSSAISGVQSNLSTHAAAQTAINAAQVVTNSDQSASISGLQADLSTHETAQTAINADQSASITQNTINLATFQTTQGLTNTGMTLGLSSKLEVVDYRPRDEFIESGTFSANVLTHTFDTNNLYMNQLVTSIPFVLDLTIDDPQNGQLYTQNILIDCLEFKGYINTLRVNGVATELKYMQGDENINLAPIAGYSAIKQTIEMTYWGGTWLFAISKIQLFWNSISNRVYDVTPPVIVLNGGGVVYHEINTTYVDAGALSSIDNIDGDITVDIVTDVSEVNTAILGTYNVYYTSTDSNLNVAMKIRVVNVIDTTNPVVTLVGLAEMTLTTNETYVEEGATAVDNSGEVLTVVITGSVNTSVIGDYTVTYTATDSSGNTHALGRLVHVIALQLVLRYSNTATNLCDLSSFHTNLISGAVSTKKNWTLSTGATYIQGTYGVTMSSYAGVGSPYIHGMNVLFGITYTESSNGYCESGKLNTIFEHHTIGTVTYSSDAYNGTTSEFQFPSNNGGLTLSYYQTTDTNAITYTGEWVDMELPYYVQLSKISISNAPLTTWLPQRTHVLGSNDNGVTWEFIDTFAIANGPTTVDFNFTTTMKYKKLRLVFSKATTRKSWLICVIKMFGDIYTV